jgi:hypothetical protein
MRGVGERNLGRTVQVIRSRRGDAQAAMSVIGGYCSQPKNGRLLSVSDVQDRVRNGQGKDGEVIDTDSISNECQITDSVSIVIRG